MSSDDDNEIFITHNSFNTTAAEQAADFLEINNFWDVTLERIAGDGLYQPVVSDVSDTELIA